MNGRSRTLLGCATMLALAAMGCGDDHGPTAPRVGTITVDTEPDSINAPWTLTGPDGYSEAGTGDWTLSNMSVGSHTLRWGLVSGWTAPDPSQMTQTLSKSGSLTFTGVYVQRMGSISIDAAPNSIGAPWTLTGPNSYVTQGTGDLTLPGLAAGNYTVTWQPVIGWDLPMPSVQTRSLQGGSSLLFLGVYVLANPTPPEGFVYIAPGTFVMGSPTSEPQRRSDETQHTVNLTGGFYMSTYEVSEKWWIEVMGGTPTASRLPRVDVSWDMAVQFCNTLSLREGLTPAYTILSVNGNAMWNRDANGYRLPTEAEWEYACRAGTSSAFHNGTNCLSSDTEANHRGGFPLTDCLSGTSREAATDVGSFPANAWGLHDMHGNVWEWVWDGYRADYQNLPGTDPVHDVGPRWFRVTRGGSWANFAAGCRSAVRSNSDHPAESSILSGFRPVRSAS